MTVILWPENTEEIWMQGLIQTYQQTISQGTIQIRSLNWCWNLAASAFFSNWINYAVYQETPYRLEELEDDFSFYGYL